jgi:hypothetical protein
LPGLGVGLRLLTVYRDAGQPSVLQIGAECDGVPAGWRRVPRPSSGARLCRPGFVFARTPSELDELSSEVLLGGEGIVGLATQREILLRVLAAPCEGLQVVELEAVGLGAPPSQSVCVSAAP